MRKYILSIGTAALIALCSCTVTFPGVATSNPIGSKTGIAEKKIFIFPIGNTDIGIEKAAKNGGITKIATVDYSIRAGLFTTTYKTIVTGE